MINKTVLDTVLENLHSTKYINFFSLRLMFIAFPNYIMLKANSLLHFLRKYE